jgi:hypothetical protein
MAECKCTSKEHGHGDRCNQPVLGDDNFCQECQQQMKSDQLTHAEPNLTPKVNTTYTRLRNDQKAVMLGGYFNPRGIERSGDLTSAS